MKITKKLKPYVIKSMTQFLILRNSKFSLRKLKITRPKLIITVASVNKMKKKRVKTIPNILGGKGSVLSRGGYIVAIPVKT